MYFYVMPYFAEMDHDLAIKFLAYWKIQEQQCVDALSCPLSYHILVAQVIIGNTLINCMFNHGKQLFGPIILIFAFH
jgi:hypothetical protein